jgi:hypothetical protein
VAEMSPEEQWMSYAEAKALVTTYLPAAQLRSQTVQEWTGTIDLPQEIQQYYAEFGPVDIQIPNYGNAFFLPSLAGLWSYQAGYRWEYHTEADLMGWNTDWLVLADIGGDPLIYSMERKVVFHAYHGERTWKPHPLFRTLSAMAFAIVVLGTIVRIAGERFTDEDSFITEEYLQEARQRLRTALSDADVDLILRRLEWDTER